MLKTSDILDEKDPRIRKENKEVEFPISKEKKKHSIYEKNRMYFFKKAANAGNYIRLCSQN